ncbi:MAG: hypothetical protein KAV87_09665 [Desulfobacteraceae bacterium]|nr:hypothetical protein [Desulfobacteraceae bacterium]
MSDVRPILFDLEEECRSLYFKFKDMGLYKEALLLLEMLTMINKSKQGEKHEPG